jgi:protein phosphatase
MLVATGISDPGCVRANNEDYYLLAPSLGLYLVADGMGGAQGGEHASKLAAETFAEHVWQAGPGGLTIETLLDAIRVANEKVLAEAAADPALQGMGTTLVAAMDAGAEVHVVSVGDSRAYLHQDQRLRVITEDQTWVNEIGRRLGIDEASLKHHPMRHVLTMALGVNGEVRVNRYRVPIVKGMQLLLCSDGLHAVVDDDTIGRILGSDDTSESKCRQLVSVAREAGGPDNITTVLIAAS